MRSATLLLWTLSLGAGAQTIGDYSRAQSAALERSMVQAIGRPLVDGAANDSPSAAPPDRAPTPAPSKAGDGPRKADRRPTPQVLVNGVFSTRDRTLAEVMVDGIPYWLGAGDAVPHTPWALHQVSSGHVELQRSAPGLVSRIDWSAPANVRPLLPPAR